MQVAQPLSTLNLSIRSEFDALQTVLVHRPGGEIDRLTPENKTELLFEDIPYLKRMQEEHDAFTSLMRKEGIDVLYLADLLTETLENQTIRTQLVTHTTSLGAQPGIASAILENFSPARISTLLFEGITALEISEELHLNVSPTDRRHDFFVLEPIPNAYFARDPGVIIHDSLISCKAHFRARTRETLILRTIFQHHERIKHCPIIYGESLDEDRPFTIEGGDILILSDQAVAIGSSQRTRSESIARLARKLFLSGRAIRVYEIPIPAERTYMHLDTVLTIVDEGVVVSYPHVIDQIKGIRRYEPITIQDHQIVAFPLNDERPLKVILEEEFGKPLKVISTGNNDPRFAAREQGADGTNMFAISPGKVISYNRNTRTNGALQDAGIEVLEIEGAELVRGLGGPRCMTMPINRLAPGAKK